MTERKWDQTRIPKFVNISMFKTKTKKRNNKKTNYVNLEANMTHLKRENSDLQQ